jgi:hypothetical protein
MELGDVWWHLKYGEVIWAKGSLPQTDEFSQLSFASAVVWKSEWLSELILYWVYSATGFKGLVFLKAALLTGSFFVIWRLIQGYKVPAPLSMAMLAPAIYIASFYCEARPQIFSFFFFTLAIFFLEKKGKLLWLLPPLMVIWANAHGGYVIGAALICCYLIREAALLSRGQTVRNESLRFMSVCFIAVLLSLLNPNATESYIRTFKLFSGSVSKSVWIDEFQPVLEYARYQRSMSMFYVMAFLCAATALTFFSKKRSFFFRLFLFFVRGRKTFRVDFSRLFVCR